MEHHEGDEVRLTIPAAADAVRIARVGAAGLGTRLGFSFGEVEELRLAVGEAAALLTKDDPSQQLDITYDIATDGLRIRLTLHNGSAGAGRPAPDLSNMATSVLDTVVDAWEIDPDLPEVRLYKVPSDRARHHE